MDFEFINLISLKDNRQYSLETENVVSLIDLGNKVYIELIPNEIDTVVKLDQVFYSLEDILLTVSFKGRVFTLICIYSHYSTLSSGNIVFCFELFLNYKG